MISILKIALHSVIVISYLLTKKNKSFLGEKSSHREKNKKFFVSAKILTKMSSPI